jgi:hypothetical protein
LEYLVYVMPAFVFEPTDQARRWLILGLGIRLRGFGPILRLSMSLLMGFGPVMSQATGFGPIITFLILFMILFLFLFLILNLPFNDLATLYEARISAPGRM